MGINNAILDIKGQLQTLIGFSRIWNNQFRYMEEGKIESFPMPLSLIFIYSLPSSFEKQFLFHAVRLR